MRHFAFRWFWFGWIGLCLIGAVTPLYAQLPLPLVESASLTIAPTQPIEDPKAVIESQRTAVADELAAVKARIQSATDTISPELQAEWDTQAALLEKLSNLYGRQLRALEDKATLQGLQQKLDEEIALFNEQGPAEETPYTIFLADRLHDDLLSETTRVKSLESSLTNSEADLKAARNLQDEKQIKREQAQLARNNNTDPAQAPLFSARLRVAELDMQAAQAVIRLRELTLDNEKGSRDYFSKRTDFLRKKFQFIKERAIFTKKDFDDQIAKNKDEQTALDKKIQEATQKLNELENATRKARMDAAGSDPELESAENDLQLFQLRRWRVAIELYEQCKQRLVDRIQAWQRRYDLISGNVTPENAAKWLKETVSEQDKLQNESLQITQRLSSIRSETLTLATRIAEMDDAKRAVKKRLGDQKKLLEELTGILEENLSNLENSRRLFAKLQSELQEFINQQKTIFSPVQEWFGKAWELTQKVWWFRVFGVDEANSIRVRNIVIALIFLSIGLYITSRLSRLLGTRILQHVKLEPTAAQIIQSLAYYLLLAVTVLFALDVANIPLTLFAFLGGAIAIGIGFGSQNIINNFISGLILQVERPIRVGDIVEVEGTSGTVVTIGARCTQIRTPSNIDMMVPNNAFLENKVVNWTLGDSRLRISVAVGVAYGSDTQLVSRLLYQIAEETTDILKYPEAVVYFTEFGANSLDFELHFWVNLKHVADSRLVRSNVRHRIAEVFAERGIEIAFPQRDVHLETKHPLEIKMIPPG